MTAPRPFTEPYAEAAWSALWSAMKALNNLAEDMARDLSDADATDAVEAVTNVQSLLHQHSEARQRGLVRDIRRDRVRA